MKVLCELHESIYKKIYPRRGSFWEIKKEDDEIKNILNDLHSKN